MRWQSMAPGRTHASFLFSVAARDGVFPGGLRHRWTGAAACVRHRREDSGRTVAGGSSRGAVPGRRATRSRRDHRNGAYTQAVAIQQDGNKIVFRNQQNATTLGKTVNQLVINGQVVPLAVGKLKLPNGGEVTYTAPDKVSPEGVLTVTSATGDKVVIKDRGNHIDLYGTPAASRPVGSIAGMAGANDPNGPGFYQRLGQPKGQAGWGQLKKLPGGQLRVTQADADFVASWKASGKEDILG